MKHQILLVDAERRSVRVLEVALRSAGYSVRIAGNGVDALEKMDAATPDVLVTDSQLPKLDGYSLVQKLRQRPETAHVPSIVLTGPSEDWGRWQDLGVVERLLKPVFVRELVACVGLVVARRARARIVGGTAATRFGGLAGSTEDLSVVDLLQAFEMLRESGAVRLVRRAQQAEIRFRDGRAIDASVGRLRGERAIYSLLGWHDASFELEFKPVNHADVIDRSTGTLLMEGMRRLDETASTFEQERATPIPEVDHVRLLEEVGSPSSDGRPASAEAALKEPPGSTTQSETRPSSQIGPGTSPDAIPSAAPGAEPEAPGQSPTRRAQPTGAGRHPQPSPLARDPEPPAEDLALFEAGHVRMASPSSRPWTREVDPSSELPFDDDVAVQGLPRVVSRTAKRVVIASVAVATLICITAGLRTMSIRRERLAESVRRPIANPSLSVPALIAKGPSPASELANVDRTRAAGAGAPDERPEEEKSPATAEAPPGEAGPGAVGHENAAPPASAAPEREHAEPSETPPVERPAMPAAAEAKALTAAGAAASAPARGETSAATLVKEAEQALLDGANDRAVTLASEAVAATPSDAAGWLVLASAHRAMGQDEAARMDYRKCVAQALTAGVNDCRILAEK